MIELVAEVIWTNPLTIKTPGDYIDQINKLVAKNRYVLITLSAPKRPRTTGEKSQNHHLNWHIQSICLATGNDFETIKSVVKMRAVAMGYPFQTYHGLPVPKSEADASVEECALLIDAVHQLAAEEGIALKDDNGG